MLAPAPNITTCEPPDKCTSLIFIILLFYKKPHAIIILAFMLYNAFFLQYRKVTFNGALAHRQYLRHLFAGDCRRHFDEIEDFLLALSEFRLRNVSVMVSDIVAAAAAVAC